MTKKLTLGPVTKKVKKSSKGRKTTDPFEKAMIGLPLDDWGQYINEQLRAQLIDFKKAQSLREIWQKAKNKKKKEEQKKRDVRRKGSVAPKGRGEYGGHVTLTPKFANAIIRGLQTIHTIEQNRKERAGDIS